ncbi:hypothetical protein BKA65DRAFT_163948 [Rhexocercosporidium sp. MPI-PUGE-AT-0058]|nr:hypothetical protein BKA65DRAFT_163948 [Rhexocercosporidium sp. MPI-PUGE-AT-0058]
MDRRIRVRTGCVTCRRRRVKCDEAKPACGRCRAANFECGGYNPPRSAEDTLRPSSKSPPEQAFSEGSSEIVQDLAWRHNNWRIEELPLYHHFVTTTAVRLFRDDHIGFWRDQVAQMSYGVDIVYEALLAIGAMHRSTLLACKHQDLQGAAKMKVLGLKSYGKALRLLPKQLGHDSVPDILATMAVLMLLAYFECFMENAKGAFEHLWAAIQLMRNSEERLPELETANMVPVYDAMLRLDFLAQKVVPYASSSFLRFSDRAIMERPFWNRPVIKYSKAPLSDQIASEGFRQIQIICAHNTYSRVVWGCWSPVSERPSRAELLGFYSEMELWKANSPGTFESCQGLDVIQDLDPLDVAIHPIPPPVCRFTCTDAALNLATANCYLGCAVAMISTTDPDSRPRELEAFNLVYQTLSIAAGLIGRDNENSPKPYKPCDSVNMGISTLLYHGARRCYSVAWQRWIIDTLREIGHEGLSNGYAMANTLDMMCQLQERMHRHHPERQGLNAYLGPLKSRLIPLLMPVSEDGDILAFYLRYGHTELDNDEDAVQVVAKASWKQDAQGVMQGVQVGVYDSIISDEENLPLRPHAFDLFDSWRQAVQGGWHGYLSTNVRDGFVELEEAPMLCRR